MIDIHNQWIQLAIFELIVLVPFVAFGFYLTSKRPINKSPRSK